MKKWTWLPVLAVIVAVSAFGFKTIGDRFVVNLAGVEIGRALAGERSEQFPWIWQELTTHSDEQSLRLALIGACAQNDFPAARSASRRYAERATPKQLDLMEHWILNWSLHLIELNQPAQAKEVRKLLFEFGDDAAAFARMGELFFALGDTEQAEWNLAQSVKVRPNGQAYLQLGTLYAEQGILQTRTDPAEGALLLTHAATALEEAAQLDTMLFIQATYRLGDVYWKLGRPLESVNAYRQAAERGGRGQLAHLSWLELGYIYSVWWEGNLDLDLARTYFERARDAASNRTESAAALSGIAATYAAQGDMDRAQQEYRQAIAQDPEYEPAVQALKQLENK